MVKSPEQTKKQGNVGLNDLLDISSKSPSTAPNGCRSDEGLASGMDKLLTFFLEARKFTLAHHAADFEWIDSRTTLVLEFPEFMEEFIYVVIASGFKGKTAARLTPHLFAVVARELQFGHAMLADAVVEEMMEIFRNKVKIGSIARAYSLLYAEYTRVSTTWSTPQDLVSLPYIGPVTCWHLARNIGLVSCVKPDLHLKRLIGGIFGTDSDQFVQDVVGKLAKRCDMNLGTTDFCLWVFLSHKEGSVQECCDGGYRLR